VAKLVGAIALCSADRERKAMWFRDQCGNVNEWQRKPDDLLTQAMAAPLP
jgi:hypothetical protein